MERRVDPWEDFAKSILMKYTTALLITCLVQAFAMPVVAPVVPDSGRTEASVKESSAVFFAADDPYIQYMGRIDFSDPKKPRFWSPGVTVRFRFKGNSCRILINDEVMYGNSHNYVEILVDENKAYRIQMKGKGDTVLIDAAGGTPVGVVPPGTAAGAAMPAADEHTVTICKDTESGIGWLEFAGLIGESLLPPPPLPLRKMEFIGNSITCGSGMDMSGNPCGQGKWYDQHNAWMSYGALTARTLNAQWHLTAVSGIGLMHSCCNMGNIIMPRVFDKINQRVDSISWDFSRYQPDVVTVCLGQNDGVQDSAAFCGNYVHFLETIRGDYPSAKIVLLTSPMGDEKLTAVLKNYLGSIAAQRHAAGDKKVYTYYYSKRYFHGCGTHPDMDEHRQIAEELTAYVKKITGW
jgi:lysophospholipase L1-like esterase